MPKGRSSAERRRCGSKDARRIRPGAASALASDRPRTQRSPQRRAPARTRAARGASLRAGAHACRSHARTQAGASESQVAGEAVAFPNPPYLRRSAKGKRGPQPPAGGQSRRGGACGMALLAKQELANGLLANKRARQGVKPCVKAHGLETKQLASVHPVFESATARPAVGRRVPVVAPTCKWTARHGADETRYRSRARSFATGEWA